MKTIRYIDEVINAIESLNKLLYTKDAIGDYVLRGSMNDGDDGGDFLMLKNLLDKMSQSIDFIKKLKFSLLYDQINKATLKLDDSDYWNKVTDSIIFYNDLDELKNSLNSLDNYLYVFELSPFIMSEDSLMAIRNVFINRRLIELRDRLSNYTLWRNFVINIVSDDTRCDFNDSKLGLQIITALVNSDERELMESISTVSSVKSAVAILDNELFNYDLVNEYTDLVDAIYDGSISTKDIRNIFQFTQIDMNHNRSIRFDEVTEMLNLFTSDGYRYLTSNDKFFIHEFMNTVMYDSQKVIQEIYFRLNSISNNRYIKNRNLFDEYLERKDPEYINEEFVIDNTYDKSDVVTQGRIKVIPINSSFSDVKTKFGIYIDDKLYFDPIDAQKISYKVLREVTNISDIYYNRKNRYEKLNNRLELNRNLQVK